MSSRNNFRTTNTNDYNRRPPRKRDVLIKFIPLLNDPDTYPNDAEILDIIEQTPFNKIQLPLYCNRFITEGGDKNRYVTVGNILNYNKDKKSFKVIIHKQFKDVIEKCLDGYDRAELVAAVQYSEYNGKLNTITKICIDIFNYSDDEELTEVDDDELDALEPADGE